MDKVTISKKRLAEIIAKIIEGAVADAFCKIMEEAVQEERLQYFKSQPLDNPLKIRGIRELSKYLGISTATAQRLKNEGKVPFSQVGKRVFFVPSEVDKAIKVLDSKS